MVEDGIITAIGTIGDRIVEMEEIRMRIEIMDTTLREGEQTPSVAFSE